MTAPRRRRLLAHCAALLFAPLPLGGCSGSDDGSAVTARGGGGDGGMGSIDANGGRASSGSGATLDVPLAGQAPSGDEGGAGNEACRADFADAELKPVQLSFALDVSGSMGKLDLPYHDPELKWRPVVSAVSAFFEDGASAGLRASLVFFPGAADKCDAATYLEPAVAMTELPSPTFSEAIAKIDPKSKDDWRGGTPTLAVVQGSFDYMTELSATSDDAQHALVLVTDGYPQGCDDDDISSVAAAIEAARPRFPTYVIGVKNPTGGPDTVTNLDALAVAGGTDAAIFIDTGDPARTSADLADAIARIRERSTSCEAKIPPNPGGDPFDPAKVNVSMGLAGKSTQLGYDQACESKDAWRYDDAASPTTIVLCPATCGAVQADPAIELDVGFGCDTRPVVK